MKKMIMIMVIVASSLIITGCGFSTCGYTTCTSCCGYETASCCGSSGWY